MPSQTPYNQWYYPERNKITELKAQIVKQAFDYSAVNGNALKWYDKRKYLVVKSQ